MFSPIPPAARPGCDGGAGDLGRELRGEGLVGAAELPAHTPAGVAATSRRPRDDSTTTYVMAAPGAPLRYAYGVRPAPEGLLPETLSGYPYPAS